MGMKERLEFLLDPEVEPILGNLDEESKDSIRIAVHSACWMAAINPSLVEESRIALNEILAKDGSEITVEGLTKAMIDAFNRR